MLIRLLKSFKYAINGIIYCVKTERNFRIHIAFVVYVVYFLRFYQLDRTDIAVIALTCGLVIVAEAFNTAIERLTDKASPDRNRQAMRIKDIAAGAVLIGAIAAVVVGIVMFWDISVFDKIIKYHTENVFNGIKLIALTIVLAVIAFLPKRKKGNNYE